MSSNGEPAYTIRKASPAEASDVFNIIEEYCEEIDVTIRDTRAELEHYLTSARSGIWLARLNHANDGETPQQAVGCILLRPLSEIENAGEIKRLYVRPTYRGLGIAKALLSAVESYAAANGISWLYLDSKQDLQAAIQFYERSGYQPCERYNDNPQATIFMRKRIS